MNNSSKIGKKGELLTGEYLENRGFKIICFNYHSRYGEIDIISENDKYIIFVEVKTRKNFTFSRAIEAVNKFKRIKIIKTAYDYISKNDVFKQIRFDVSEVLYEREKNPKIFYYENVFDAEELNAFFWFALWYPLRDGY